MNFLRKQASQLDLKSILIYKKQSTTDFSKYFAIFRMNLLLIVKIDKNNSDILIECKNSDKLKIYKKEEFNLKHNVNMIRDRLKKKQV